MRRDFSILSSYQIHLGIHSVRIFQGVLRSSHPLLFEESLAYQSQSRLPASPLQ